MDTRKRDRNDDGDLPNAKRFKRNPLKVKDLLSWSLAILPTMEESLLEIEFHYKGNLESHHFDQNQKIIIHNNVIHILNLPTFIVDADLNISHSDIYKTYTTTIEQLRALPTYKNDEETNQRVARIIATIYAIKIVNEIHTHNIPFPLSKFGDTKEKALIMFNEHRELYNQNTLANILVTKKFDTSRTGIAITNPYTEEVLLKTYRRHIGNNCDENVLSPYNIWVNPLMSRQFALLIKHSIEHILKNKIDDKLTINNSYIRSQLTRYYKVAKFSIFATIQFLQMAKREMDYDKIKFFIPAGGYGERLVAAEMLDAVTSITTLDTDKVLCERYQEMHNDFAVENKTLTIINKPMEKATLNDIGVQDCIFTSPPYMRRKEGKYKDEYIELGDVTNNPEHCNRLYKTSDLWFENFFKPFVLNCFHTLRVGGIFGFVISQEMNQYLLNHLIIDNKLDGLPIQILGKVTYPVKVVRLKGKEAAHEVATIVRKLTLFPLQKSLPKNEDNMDPEIDDKMEVDTKANKPKKLKLMFNNFK